MEGTAVYNHSRWLGGKSVHTQAADDTLLAKLQEESHEEGPDLVTVCDKMGLARPRILSVDSMREEEESRILEAGTKRKKG